MQDVDDEEQETRIVWRTHDPMQAELVVDFLGDNGVKARLAGAPRVTMLSAVDEGGERRLEVAAAQAEDAERLIEEFLAAQPVEADDADLDSDEDSDDDSAPAQPRLRRIFAAGVTPVLPGASHFYARRPWTGAAILVAQAAALTAIVGARGEVAEIATVVFWGLLLFDLIGGQVAVGKWNQGLRAGTGRQLLSGVAAVCLLGVAGVVLAPILRKVPPPRHDDGSGNDDAAGFRRGTGRPDGLPFPLHLDLSR
jgi:hypothetical protein